VDHRTVAVLEYIEHQKKYVKEAKWNLLQTEKNQQKEMSLNLHTSKLSK
jgi:hypothetical protein